MKASKRTHLALDTFFIIICAAAALAMGICIYALPRKSFSEQENRSLSPAPAITVSSVASGSFFTSLSDFYSDHIPLRKQLIQAKAVFELYLGKAQNNNVIFLSDGRQTDKPHYESTHLLEKNLNALSSFSAALGSDPLYVFVPRSIDALLPDSEENTRIRCLVTNSGPDVSDLLQTLDIGDYYNTDHHLTTDGAYRLYRHIADGLGITPYCLEDFSVELASEDFLGSTYSKSGLLATKYDAVYLHRYSGDEGYTVVCHDSGCTLDSLYDTEKLKAKDKYTVFLGGNHGKVTITEEGANKPHLLLIKDSFANAVIPFLARHFDITVIDPRYSASSIQKLISADEYDNTVILCGIDTLATNGAFEKLLY